MASCFGIYSVYLHLFLRFMGRHFRAFLSMKENPGIWTFCKLFKLIIDSTG
ncbi:predicted protein [Micromonas commoda]|uniref:Uncharacterized protein n=1 Tax=Micromonas commoda (strain RCC299 / NOUM17 / CCMP2709) TaxID=296587 RepID=C1FEB8_MICCC|nr:predicted protein [Micromonas commoda]ACO68538.1 predicted protein [Micromonas commoda]|eukprot:XP_002507280.1 predicted protein [Micromonas commoda]